jgi:HEAT repeats
MIRRGILVLLLGFFFCTSLCLSLQAKTALASEAAYTDSIAVSPAATATQSVKATATSTSSSGGDSSSWTSPVIAVAIIVAIIGAVALWANTPLTVWLTSRSEQKKEKREEQKRKEEQEKAEREQQKRLQEEQAARVAEEEARKKALDEHVRFYRERLVRQHIASMLANSTDTSIVSPLCKLAIDRVVNLSVRKSVIETLGEIADDRATVEALVELVNDDRQVRDEAVEALWYVSRRARVRVVADELTRRVRVEA